MKQRIPLRNVDVVLVLLAFGLVLALARVAAPGNLGTGVIVAGTAALLVGMLLLIYRMTDARLDDLRRSQLQDYRQVEALLSIMAVLQPRMPLPQTRGWAASPDFLLKVVETILETRPKVVVEASSGVSSLVVAYCLQRLGQGRVISLEHEAEFAAKTRALLSLHGLEGFATVIHAPLKEFEIGTGTWLWYGLDGVGEDEKIDVLVVDGPPEQVQEMARYPALPLLYERLNVGAVVLLDDGGREAEKAAVARWKMEHDSISSEFLDLEKGAYRIEKLERGGSR